MARTVTCHMGQQCLAVSRRGAPSPTVFVSRCGCELAWSLRGRGWVHIGKKSKGGWACRECCDGWGPEYEFSVIGALDAHYQCDSCVPEANRNAFNDGRPIPPPVPLMLEDVPQPAMQQEMSDQAAAHREEVARALSAVEQLLEKAKAEEAAGISSVQQQREVQMQRQKQRPRLQRQRPRLQKFSLRLP